MHEDADFLSKKKDDHVSLHMFKMAKIFKISRLGYAPLHYV